MQLAKSKIADEQMDLGNLVSILFAKYRAQKSDKQM